MKTEKANAAVPVKSSGALNPATRNEKTPKPKSSVAKNGTNGTPTSPLEVFEALRDTAVSGELIPIIPDTAPVTKKMKKPGKVPGFLGRNETWLPRDDWETGVPLPETERLLRRGANLGVLTRTHPCLDVDVYAEVDRPVADAVEAYANETLGATVVRTRASCPSRTLIHELEGEPFDKPRTLWFTTPSGARCAIERLANGQQTVISGTHHPSKDTLHLSAMPTPDNLAKVNKRKAEEFSEGVWVVLEAAGCTDIGWTEKPAVANQDPEKTSTVGPVGYADPWRVEKALKHVPADTYELWLSVEFLIRDLDSRPAPVPRDGPWWELAKRYDKKRPKSDTKEGWDKTLQDLWGEKGSKRKLGLGGLYWKATQAKKNWQPTAEEVVEHVLEVLRRLPKVGLRDHYEHLAEFNGLSLPDRRSIERYVGEQLGWPSDYDRKADRARARAEVADHGLLTDVEALRWPDEKETDENEDTGAPPLSWQALYEKVGLSTSKIDRPDLVYVQRANSFTFLPSFEVRTLESENLQADLVETAARSELLKSIDRDNSEQVKKVDRIIRDKRCTVAYDQSRFPESGRLVRFGGRAWLNTNRYPLPAAVQGKLPLLDELMHAIAGGEAEYEWLLNWAAYLVQNPRVLPGVAVAAHSEGRGQGKSWLGLLLGLCRGCPSIINHERLWGEFNDDWMSGNFTVGNEAVASSTKKKDMDRLNILVTEPSITWNAKHIRQREIENYQAFWLTSNLPPVYIPTGDRRWTIFDSQWPGDAKGSKEWLQLGAIYRNHQTTGYHLWPELQALRWKLLHHEVDVQRARGFLENKARTAVQRATASHADALANALDEHGLQGILERLNEDARRDAKRLGRFNAEDIVAFDVEDQRLYRPEGPYVWALWDEFVRVYRAWAKAEGREYTKVGDALSQELDTTRFPSTRKVFKEKKDTDGGYVGMNQQRARRVRLKPLPQEDEAA